MRRVAPAVARVGQPQRRRVPAQDGSEHVVTFHAMPHHVRRQAPHLICHSTSLGIPQEAFVALPAAAALDLERRAQAAIQVGGGAGVPQVAGHRLQLTPASSAAVWKRRLNSYTLKRVMRPSCSL